ncbi:hypothetical protein N0V90_008437 [Kalmusia sp. IMI 367209]|nr:hypothetical protein N0V90_008437 [Kalmusia sp. IMI 367209]
MQFTPATRRFERIAHDLEKLPCELHGAVLNELDFEQLIRLSRVAGPRLAWSLSNSLAPWGRWFRSGGGPKWQKYLDATDQVRKLCYKQPRSKDDETFYDADFAFLCHRSGDWESRTSYANRHKLLNEDSLSAHWLSSLNEQVFQKTWYALHRDYSTNVEPWFAHLKRAHGPGRVSVLHKLQARSPPHFINRPFHLGTQRRELELSLNELATFIDVYQEIRLVRAEALAAELNRLADLYEKYPNCLKMPFAPQTRRRNKEHVLRRLRIDARKVVDGAKHGRWAYSDTCRYRFTQPFPALVPYEYCRQLSLKMKNLDCPKDVMANYKIMCEGPSRLGVSVKNDPNAGITAAFDQLGMEDDNLTPEKNCKPRTSHLYCPYGEATLKWLEAFCIASKWMEDNYPEIVQEVRGATWTDG